MYIPCTSRLEATREGQERGGPGAFLRGLNAPRYVSLRCRLAQVLQADTEKKIKAVCVVHNETTTGVTSDIPEVRAARPPCCPFGLHGMHSRPPSCRAAPRRAATCWGAAWAPGSTQRVRCVWLADAQSGSRRSYRRHVPLLPSPPGQPAAGAVAISARPASHAPRSNARAPGWPPAPCRPPLRSGTCERVLQVRKTLDAANHPALLLVDGVSSIGALDFQFDSWRVDVAVTGSQKALSIPTGLAMVCASDKALTAMKSATSRRALAPHTAAILPALLGRSLWLCRL